MSNRSYVEYHHPLRVRVYDKLVELTGNKGFDVYQEKSRYFSLITFYIPLESVKENSELMEQIEKLEGLIHRNFKDSLQRVDINHPYAETPNREGIKIDCEFSKKYLVKNKVQATVIFG